MLRIKELRNEKGLTQKQLAEKIYSTDKNIWAYESQVAVPPLDTLIKLADFFNCSLDYLVGRSDDFGNINVIEINEPLMENEKAILGAYKTLPQDLQHRLLAYLYKLVELSKMETS